MKSLTTIAKGAGFVFGGMIVSKFFTYLYRVIIARIGTSEYGSLSLALAIFGMCGVVSVLGLNVGIVHFTSRYKASGQIQKVKEALMGSLQLSVSLSIVIAIVLVILSGQIGRFFNDSNVAHFVTLLALMLPLYASRDIIMACIRAYTKNSVYDVLSRNVFESILKVVITAILIGVGYKALGAVYAMMIGLILTFLLAVYWAYSLLPIQNCRIDNSAHKIVSMLRYSFPLLLTALLMQVLLWTDVLMLGFYRDTSVVGIYNAALPTATLMSIIPGGIIALFLPVISGLLTEKKHAEFEDTLVTCTKWIFFLDLPVFIALAIFPSEILGTIFGQEYVSGGSALMILAIGYLFYQFFQTSSETLNALEKTSLVFVNTIAAAVTNVALNYMLIPTLGMRGGAIATATALIVFAVLAGIETYMYTNIVVIRPVLLKAVIAGVIAGAVGIGVTASIDNSLGFILGLVTIGITYPLLVILFGSLNADDKNIVKAIVKRIRR